MSSTYVSQSLNQVSPDRPLGWRPEALVCGPTSPVAAIGYTARQESIGGMDTTMQLENVHNTEYVFIIWGRIVRNAL